MTCDHEEIFTRYVAGELGDVEEANARRAIETCSVCRYRLDVLHATETRHVTPDGSALDVALHQEAPPPRGIEPKRALTPWLVGAALVVGACGLLTIFFLWSSDEVPQPVAQAPAPPPQTTSHAPSNQPPKTAGAWRDVKVVKAPYAAPRPQLQPAAPAGSPTRPHETPFDRAMRPYLRNDFAEAASALAPLSRSGDIRATFYLGVSLLLSDRPDEAVEPLTRVARAWRGHLGAQAQYYLAIAHLRTYQFQEALLELKAVQEIGGPYASRAAELEEEVRSSAL